MKQSYDRTMYACFAGYVVQAVVNNFLPLLFLTLQREYGVPLRQITLLITVNFGVQLTVDLLAALFAEKLGARAVMVTAHVLSAAGFLLLPVLPERMPPFAGILTAVVLYAVGGGLLEVMVSPIAESCPTPHKAKAMSLLHSFYCWGQVGVVMLSTLFFTVFGTAHWRILCAFWALLPAANALNFLRVPIVSPEETGDSGMTLRELLRSSLFPRTVLMMVCAGASELTVSQWASFFAEQGLQISKTAGDLAGPMLFAVLMGSARLFYGKCGDRLDLDRFMRLSAALCVGAYLTVSLVPHPAVNLAGCAVCGLPVGIMWPGTFSKAARGLRRGGTMMFSLLALAGDIGCMSGPTLAGLVADCTSLKTGIFAAAVFPLLMLLACIKTRTEKKGDCL